MAEEPTHILRETHSMVNSLAQSLRAQGLYGKVGQFSGEGKDFQAWLADIEKQSFLLHATEEETKNMAYHSCKGIVSDFIRHRFQCFPQESWSDLKSMLRSEFSQYRHPDLAFNALTKLGREGVSPLKYMGTNLLNWWKRLSLWLMH